jgi:prepilin-type processing-associated H-X9-DG protein
LLLGEATFGAFSEKYQSRWNEAFAVMSTIRGINNQTLWNYYGMSFASLHSGGAQFAMADGAVVFLSDSTDIITFCRLGTRAKGEVIDSSKL